MPFGNIKFHYENWWDEGVISYSTQHVNWPATNTQKRWKTETWRSNYGNNSGWGRFIIDSTNQWLYFTEDGDSLVTDPGLEIWASATNLTHWTESKGATCSIDRESTDVWKGSYSCKLTQGGGVGEFAMIYQDIAITDAGTYQICLWYKNSAASKTLKLSLFDTPGNNVFLKEDGTWNAGSYNIDVPNSLTWTAIMITFDKHPSYVNYRLRVYVNDVTHDSAHAFVDDFFVCPYPTHSAEIPLGTYDADSLADAIGDAMDVSGTWDYTCIYNDVTNKFEIYAVDSGNPRFQLNTTITTNDIWPAIGFDTDEDTDFETYHIADNMRIHTSESITCYYVGQQFDTIVLQGHNLQTDALVTAQASNSAGFANYVESAMVRGENNCYYVEAPATVPRSYVRIVIRDIDNPDGYIEVGRIWVSRTFQPEIGVNPKWKHSQVDPSLVKYSEGGQISTIQRTHYRIWDFSIDFIKLTDRTTLETLFDERGTSREFFITLKPHNPATTTFEDPEDNTYYVHFKKLTFDMRDGVWGAKLGFEEER
jgi:hypothetical protein